MADSNIFRLSGVTPDIGTTFQPGKDGVVIYSQALQLMGEKAEANTLGEKVSIELYIPNANGSSQNVSIPESLPIVGVISDAQQPPLVIIPASSVPITIPSYNEVYLKATDAATMTALRDTLTQKGFVISANIDLITQAEKITNIVTTILAIFGITALIVSAIGMFNTMLIGFIERTYEVGVMKAIGATDANVRDLFLMESAVIGLLGGTGGIIIGLGLGSLTNTVLNIISRQMGGQSFNLFILPLWFGILVFVLSIFIGVISGFIPARRAAKLSPREAFTRK